MLQVSFLRLFFFLVEDIFLDLKFLIHQVFRALGVVASDKKLI